MGSALCHESRNFGIRNVDSLVQFLCNVQHNVVRIHGVFQYCSHVIDYNVQFATTTRIPERLYSCSYELLQVTNRPPASMHAPV